MRRFLSDRLVLACGLGLLGASAVLAMHGWLAAALPLWAMGLIATGFSKGVQQFLLSSLPPRDAELVCVGEWDGVPVRILRSTFAFWLVPRWTVFEGRLLSPLMPIRIREVSILSSRLVVDSIDLEFLNDLEEKRVVQLANLSDADRLLTLLEMSHVKVL